MIENSDGHIYSLDEQEVKTTNTPIKIPIQNK